MCAGLTTPVIVAFMLRADAFVFRSKADRWTPVGMKRADVLSSFLLVMQGTVRSSRVM